eukprot:755998-Pelagomonas_calceolata.AAC.4
MRREEGSRERPGEKKPLAQPAPSTQALVSRAWMLARRWAVMVALSTKSAKWGHLAKGTKGPLFGAFVVHLWNFPMRKRQSAKEVTCKTKQRTRNQFERRNDKGRKATGTC